eukprot:3396705-Amphidinium_carterae.2
MGCGSNKSCAKPLRDFILCGMSTRRPYFQIIWILGLQALLWSLIGWRVSCGCSKAIQIGVAIFEDTAV